VDGIKFDEHNILTLTHNQTLKGNIMMSGRAGEDDGSKSASLIADHGIYVKGRYNGHQLQQTFDQLVINLLLIIELFYCSDDRACMY